MTHRPERATSLDVAALAGVSQSAVSRAFTHGSSIKAATRSKILQAAQTLNYVPNSIASSLTTRHSNIVALVLGSLQNPFYTRVFEQFNAELQKKGRQTLTLILDEDVSADDAIMRVLQYQVEAIILTSAQMSTRTVDLCHNRGIPLVLFNRYAPFSKTYGVRCDNEGGGRVIAEALLGAGASSFLIITGDPNGSTSPDRVRGCVTRLLAAGIAPDKIHQIPGRSTYEGGGAAIDQFAATGRAFPDAVFGVSDIMAMGAMDTLRLRYGQRMPEDIMIAGFDGVPEAARPPYQLTTMSQPLQRMVAETIDLLNLDADRPDDSLREDRPFPGELIWRSTIPRSRNAQPLT